MSRRSWCFATDQRHETDGQLRSGSRTSAVAFASESPHRMLAGGDLVACADVGVGCDPSISFKNAQNLIYLVGKRVPCSHDVGVVITQEHECRLFDDLFAEQNREGGVLAEAIAQVFSLGCNILRKFGIGLFSRQHGRTPGGPHLGSQRDRLLQYHRWSAGRLRSL